MISKLNNLNVFMLWFVYYIIIYIITLMFMYVQYYFTHQIIWNNIIIMRTNKMLWTESIIYLL